MRTVTPTRPAAALLIVLCIAPSARAIKPAHTGRSAEATVRYLNQQLHAEPNFAKLYCSNRAELSLSPDRREIIVTYWLIDKHGKDRAELPPQYIYRIPVAAVQNAYIGGRWDTNDRVIVTTRGKVVIKVGPFWDCFRNKPKRVPKQRMLNNVHLLVWNATDKRLYRIAEAFKHLVEVLQTEPPPKPRDTPAKETPPIPNERPRLTDPAPQWEEGATP